jgi:hypothetical protein
MASQLANQARDAAVLLGRWLSRPRVRLTVTGVLLLVVGGVFVSGSVWTLPLLIAGVLMVAIAWVGHRLDGRLAVEWGQAGTQLEFRAQIKAAESPHAALAETTTGPRRVETETGPEPEDADVVEGEAHTVEIEVAELKALIAAAGTAEIATAPAEEVLHAERNLRAAR